MKTVKELKEELSKFDDDDTCYAYEGEVIGIIVEREGDYKQGVIFCSGSEDPEQTILIEKE
jgi:hypothetical protein